MIHFLANKKFDPFVYAALNSSSTLPPSLPSMYVFTHSLIQAITHLVKDSPLFDSNAASSGPNSGSSSPEPHDEEAIFTLLFQQCDSEGTGEVGVEQLISYIRKVRLGQQHSDKEEVYVSQDDVRSD